METSDERTFRHYMEIHNSSTRSKPKRDIKTKRLMN